MEHQRGVAVVLDKWAAKAVRVRTIPERHPISDTE